MLRVAIAGFLLILIAALPASAEELLMVRSYKMAGDATRMRVILQFDREPKLDWFLLRGPHRLVVDFPEAGFAIDPEDLKPRGFIANIRYGQSGEGRSRMILSTRGPFQVEAVEVLANENSDGFRMVADLVAASEAEFEVALARQERATDVTGGTSTPRGDRVGAGSAEEDRRFTVAIDPGHGGIDGGAESPGGTVEKTVTLAFSRELKLALERVPGFRVVMTREKDEFLRLDERVRIARQHGADLFISIHADTIRLKGIRGATVYTLSETASDAEAAALAARENLADELAGIVVEEEKSEVADILVDLIRRETHHFSIRFARSLVGEMKGKVLLINNPHRSAGFRVLRAPDIPSVLVELGYLSNPKDEAQLLDPEWRGKAVASIAAAVARFAAAWTGAGG